MYKVEHLLEYFYYRHVKSKTITRIFLSQASSSLPRIGVEEV